MSNEFKSAGETGESITDGIDINNWSINRQGVALTFGVWDFAGQTLYYNTHQVRNIAAKMNKNKWM